MHECIGAHNAKKSNIKILSYVFKPNWTSKIAGYLFDLETAKFASVLP